MRSAARWLRGRHPPIVTATIIAAVISTGLRFGVFAHELPLTVAYRSGSSGRALLAGRYDTIVSSQLLTRDGFMLTSIVLSLAVMLGGYELLAGSRRAAIVAVSAAVASPVVVALVLAGGSALNIGFAGRTLSTLDYGASSITAGAGGALVAILGRRWLRRAAVLFVLGGLVLHHQLADWEHLVAFPLGFAIARLPRPRSAHSFGLPTAVPVRSRPGWRAAGLAGTAVGVLAGTMGASSAIAAPVTTIAEDAPTRPGASSAGTGPLSPLRVIDTRYPTPSLGGERRVLVVVPAGYDGTGGGYPAIEILHGQPGNPQDLLTALDLAAVMAASPPFIAVVPDGHGPVVTDGDFADTSRQRLGAALSDDLRRWVDTTYRTTGRWGVTGLSAGGFGAASLASRPTGGYARVCPMSGYFTAQDSPFKGEGRRVRDAASPLLHVAATGPATMLIVGDADTAGLTEAYSYIAALQRAGQPHDLVIVPGRHDFGVWRAALPQCVRFLLSDDPPHA